MVQRTLERIEKHGTAIHKPVPETTDPAQLDVTKIKLLEFEDGKTKPGYRARHLAQYQDMVEFFKMFLFSFQYPGAHIKVHSCFDQIRNGVKFKPAKYILLLLQYAESTTGKREYITKAEACHCIFNALRCMGQNY